MEQLGYDTAFDRFDKQQPQCTFGLSGTCCRICNMGPCKITPKSPRGVCGADADLIVARNLLRGAAAGAAFGAATGAAAGALTLPVSSTVTSYAVPFTVIVQLFIFNPPKIVNYLFLRLILRMERTTNPSVVVPSDAAIAAAITAISSELSVSS